MFFFYLMLLPITYVSLCCTLYLLFNLNSELSEVDFIMTGYVCYHFFVVEKMMLRKCYATLYTD